MIVPALAYSAPVEYNPVLEEIGITEEDFWAMSPEKRAFYQDVQEITANTSTTKYFHIIYDFDALDSEGNPASHSVEVTESEYAEGKNAQQNSPAVSREQIKSDQTSGAWYSMTTTLSEMAVTGGELHYYVVNKLTIDQSGMGLLNADRRGYIGVSLNANTSPVAGSEWMTREYTYNLDPSTRRKDYVESAPFKGYGYAFDFGIANTIRDIEVTMTYQVMPNTNLKILDAYGFAGYWKGTVVPSISIGPGLKISFSFDEKRIPADDTHVQLFI